MARINSNAKTYVYNCYVTDALKIITSNTASFVGGVELAVSYKDMINQESENAKAEAEAEAEKVINKMKQKISSLSQE